MAEGQGNSVDLCINLLVNLALKEDIGEDKIRSIVSQRFVDETHVQAANADQATDQFLEAINKIRSKYSGDTQSIINLLKTFSVCFLLNLNFYINYLFFSQQ